MTDIKYTRRDHKRMKKYYKRMDKSDKQDFLHFLKMNPEYKETMMKERKKEAKEMKLAKKDEKEYLLFMKKQSIQPVRCNECGNIWGKSQLVNTTLKGERRKRCPACLKIIPKQK